MEVVSVREKVLSYLNVVKELLNEDYDDVDDIIDYCIRKI